MFRHYSVISKRLLLFNVHSTLVETFLWSALFQMILNKLEYITDRAALSAAIMKIGCRETFRNISEKSVRNHYLFSYIYKMVVPARHNGVQLPLLTWNRVYINRSCSKSQESNTGARILFRFNQNGATSHNLNWMLCFNINLIVSCKGKHFVMFYNNYYKITVSD